jgi:hypothetical protein
LADFHLAALAFPLFLTGHGHGTRHAGFVIDQADEAHRIADELAVERQRGR